MLQGVLSLAPAEVWIVVPPSLADCAGPFFMLLPIYLVSLVPLTRTSGRDATPTPLPLVFNAFLTMFLIPLPVALPPPLRVFVRHQNVSVGCDNPTP